MIFILIFIAQNNNTAQSRLKIEGNSDEFAEFNELHPNIIGYYCIDDGIFSLTAKHLKYLRSNYENWTRRHKNFNLGDGIDTYKRKPGKGENDEKINFLLQWISEKKFLHEISGENAVSLNSPVSKVIMVPNFFVILSTEK